MERWMRIERKITLKEFLNVSITINDIKKNGSGGRGRGESYHL